MNSRVKFGTKTERPEENSLEVREEILGSQVDDEGSQGPRLVEGIVYEESTCRETESRDKMIREKRGRGAQHRGQDLIRW